MERMLFAGLSDRDLGGNEVNYSLSDQRQATGGRPRKMSASWNEGEHRKNGEWNVSLLLLESFCLTSRVDPKLLH